jgi:hypothetical protein
MLGALSVYDQPVLESGERPLAGPLGLVALLGQAPVPGINIF